MFWSPFDITGSGHLLWHLVLCLTMSCLVCLSVEALKCPPCSKIHCSPKMASRLQCKGGITTGVCGCCPVCAKLELEKCGGEYAYQGKCDRGLTCVPMASSPATFISRVHTLSSEAVGICKKVSKKKSRGQQRDAAFVNSCRPKCTPQFCQRRPKAVCSARDSVDTIVSCQGKCQHTSCRACSIVKERECPSCAHDDFRCLKKFGRCIQKHSCRSRKRICRPSKVNKNLEIKGKFVCEIPQCFSPPWPRDEPAGILAAPTRDS